MGELIAHNSEIEQDRRLFSVRDMLFPYLTKGYADQAIFIGDEKESVLNFLDEIANAGYQMYAVGKFAILSAMAASPHSFDGRVDNDGFMLNNFLRTWFNIHQDGGNQDEINLDYYFHHAGEFKFPTSDIDIKTDCPSDIIREAYQRHCTRSPLCTKLREYRIPSRKNVVGQRIEYHEGSFSRPHIRLDFATLCKPKETKFDRRWDGVNRLQTIRAKFSPGQVLQLNQRDIKVAQLGQDSYYPEPTDPIDKVGVTISRMLVYAAFRSQIGYINIGDEISESSQECCVEYFKKHVSQIISPAAINEILLNILVASIIEPNVVRHIPAFGIQNHLPSHLSKLDWNRIRNTSFSTWLNLDFDPYGSTALARMVYKIQNLPPSIQTEELSHYQKILLNQRAMVWLLTGKTVSL